MNKEKRFFIITSILTLLSTVLFNHLYASDFLVDTAKNLIDTTAVKFSDIQQHPAALLDIASILPFHSDYLSWDTLSVHPYHFDMTHMTDTVKLVLTDDGDCAFIAPIAGFMTSGFGVRTAPRYRYVKRGKGKRGRSKAYFTGYGTQYHYGVDLQLHTGDSVGAAFDGVVRISQYNMGGYGNCVVIRHYNGLETLYGHLSARLVNPGQVVKAGEIVGLGGSTGHSTGPHLHFETRYKGQPIDPTTFINFAAGKDSTGVHYALRSDTLTITRRTFNYFGTSAYSRRGKYRRTPTYAYNPKVASVATASVATTGANYYVVRKGDNIYRIATQNGTTVNRVCQLNRLARTTTLQPGMRLKVK